MAVSVVQSIAHVGNPPATFSGGVTAGNTVFLVAAGYTTTSGNPTISAVKLGGSSVTGTVAFFNNSTTGGVLSPLNAGNGAFISIWMIPNIPGGGTTVDYTAANFSGMIGQVIYEVAGLGTNPSLDQSNSGGSGTGTAVNSGTTGAITSASEIVFGGTMAFAGTPATNSGWTCLQPSGGADLTAGYQIPVSSGGTYNWSQTSSGSPWAAFVATVAATPAAPPAVYIVASAPYRPPPPGKAPAPQLFTGPLPAPPATLTGIVASPGTPFRVPLLTAPQILGTVAGSTTQATAGLSGTGSLTASPVLTGTAGLSGQGTLTAATTTGTAVTLSGSGTLSAATTTGTTAALSGAGTLTALWTLKDTLTLSGQGTLSVSQNAGSANLTGTGTLTAAPQLAGSVSVAGLGTLTAAPVQALQAAAALSGLGTLTAAETFTASVALSGLGTLTVAPAFQVARSTSSVTDPRDGTDTVTAVATSTSGVT